MLVCAVDTLPKAVDTLPEAIDILPKAIDILPEAIDTLPEEIQTIILDFMLPRYKLFLNKTYYLRYHNIIFQHIPKNNIELYIRSMVRQDNAFVFQQLVSDNWYKWLNTTNYCYRGRNYVSYIEFLNDYCFEHGAHKSKQLLYYFT